VITRPVAITAQFTAKAREIESQRTDALFNDPWAHLFSGEAGRRWLARQPEKNAGLTLALRTRYLDDLLAAHQNEQAMRQVVILAAGYDTRAYRLSWPSQTRLFEIDQPAVLEYKDQQLLAAGAVPGCERKAIGMDLKFAWEGPLLEAGFQPELPSVWIVEGLLMYLTAADASQLLETISRLTASGSWMGFDMLNQATLTSPLTQDRISRLAQRGMAWQFGVDDPTGWIEPYGWTAEVTRLNAAARQYQRFSKESAFAANPDGARPDVFFVTAHRC
jgi:methyltransferase (TIGR00027 family)